MKKKNIDILSYNQSSLESLAKLSDYSKRETIINALDGIHLDADLFKIPQGSIIFRARCEYEDFKINSKDEISYHPNAKSVKRGRSNPAGLQVFYGSIMPKFDDKNKVQILNTTLMEASKLVRERKIGQEFGYVGGWVSTKKINVVTFLNFEYGPYANTDILDIREQCLKDALSSSNNPNYVMEVNRIIASWFAKKYSKRDSNKYKLSSTIGEFYLNHQSEIDGIIYPSVINKAAAFNIALSKDAVDNKLDFRSCVKITGHLDSNAEYQYRGIGHIDLS